MVPLAHANQLPLPKIVRALLFMILLT